MKKPTRSLTDTWDQPWSICIVVLVDKSGVAIVLGTFIMGFVFVVGFFFFFSTIIFVALHLRGVAIILGTFIMGFVSVVLILKRVKFSLKFGF